MERRRFIELIGVSSVMGLSGCNAIQNENDDVTTTRPPDGAVGADTATSPENTTDEPSEHSIEIDFENISNSYYIDGTDPSLRTRLFMWIRNPSDTEKQTEINVEIDERNTIERTVPPGTSKLTYSTEIETEGEYTVTLDGESVAEIEFAPISIANTYLANGVGQSTPNNFGHLQEVQKIDFEASAVLESSTLDVPDGALCNTLDFAVADDLLYVYNEWRSNEVMTEKFGYSVHGFDIWNNEERWSRTFGKDMNQDPGPGLLTVTDEHLYYISPDGIHAVNLQSNEETWNVTANRPQKIFLYEDTLFAVVEDDESLYALHSATGERKWSDNETVGAQSGVDILAASANKAIIRTNDSSGVHSVNISDGSSNWDFDSFSEPRLSNECAYSGSHVFVTADVRFSQDAPDAGAMGLYCLDAQTGEQVWRNPISRSYKIPDLAVFGNRNDIIQVDSKNSFIYVYGTGNDEFGLQCFDISTGELEWRSELPSSDTNRNPIQSGVKCGEYLYGRAGSLSRYVWIGEDLEEVKPNEAILIDKNQIGSTDEPLSKELPPVFAQGLLFYAYDTKPQNYIKIFSGKKPE